MDKKVDINIVGIQNNINVDGSTANEILSAITPDFVKDGFGILSDNLVTMKFLKI